MAISQDATTSGGSSGAGFLRIRGRILVVRLQVFSSFAVIQMRAVLLRFRLLLITAFR